MEYLAGIDMSVEGWSRCVVHGSGTIVAAAKVTIEREGSRPGCAAGARVADVDATVRGVARAQLRGRRRCRSPRMAAAPGAARLTPGEATETAGGSPLRRSPSPPYRARPGVSPDRGDVAAPRRRLGS